MAEEETHTLFTWGYWGWGNTTRELVEAVDSVERARGFAPPIFVDIRISRSVRARGFSGNAFEQLVGSARYRWLRDLGNASVERRSELPIHIKNPAAASTLLGISVRARALRRRVLFYCACEFPYVEHAANACHRVVVARLVLEAARRRQLPVEVVEWPGGEPADVILRLPVAKARQLLRGRKSIQLDAHRAGEYVALPWGSLAHFEVGEDRYAVITGPARYVRSGGWYLPVLSAATRDIVGLRRRTATWRKHHGLEPRQA